MVRVRELHRLLIHGVELPRGPRETVPRIAKVWSSPWGKHYPWVWPGTLETGGGSLPSFCCVSPRGHRKHSGFGFSVAAGCHEALLNEAQEANLAARPRSRSMQPRELGPTKITASPYPEPHCQQLRRDGLGNPGLRPAPNPHWRWTTPDLEVPRILGDGDAGGVQGLGITVSEKAPTAAVCQVAKCRGRMGIGGLVS